MILIKRVLVSWNTNRGGILLRPKKPPILRGSPHAIDLSKGTLKNLSPTTLVQILSTFSL